MKTFFGGAWHDHGLLRIDFPHGVVKVRPLRGPARNVRAAYITAVSTHDSAPSGVSESLRVPGTIVQRPCRGVFGVVHSVDTGGHVVVWDDGTVTAVAAAQPFEMRRLRITLVLYDPRADPGDWTVYASSLAAATASLERSLCTVSPRLLLSCDCEERLRELDTMRELASVDEVVQSVC